MFWRCLHCETHNATERSRCLICGGERLYTASEVAGLVGVDFNGVSGAEWWGALPKAYKTHFIRLYAIFGEPDVETLLRIRFATRLDLSRKAVESAEPLAAIPYLERLNLNKTRIQTLEPLSRLQCLTELRLDGTPIESLAPLKNLRALKKIYVRACAALAAGEVVAFRSARPDCRVFADKSTGISPVSPRKPIIEPPKEAEAAAKTDDKSKRSFFSIFKRK